MHSTILVSSLGRDPRTGGDSVAIDSCVCAVWCGCRAIASDVEIGEV